MATIAEIRERAEDFQRIRQNLKRQEEERLDSEMSAALERMLQYTKSHPGEIEAKRVASEVEQKREARQRRLQSFQDICPREYFATDVARLPRQVQFNRVIEWRKAWGADKPGLILYGPSGTGKTRSAWTLMQRLAVDESLSVRGDSATVWACDCIENAKTGKSGEWLRGLLSYRCLFLDDLDKVKFTERVEMDLFTLLETRFNQGRLTLFTMNSVGSQFEQMLKQKHAPYVLRRMKEFCHSINFEPEQ